MAFDAASRLAGGRHPAGGPDPSLNPVENDRARKRRAGNKKCQHYAYAGRAKWGSRSPARGNAPEMAYNAASRLAGGRHPAGGPDPSLNPVENGRARENGLAARMPALCLGWAVQSGAHDAPRAATHPR